MKKFSHISGRFYETGGAAIYYEGIGDPRDPAVVLLHGGLGNMEDFNELLSLFRDQFFLLGIDSRGQGRSTIGNTPLTYEQLALDVAALLKFLHIEMCSVVGLGDGGIVGYRLAAAHHLKINRLVTIGAGGSAGDLSYRGPLFLKTTAAGWMEKSPRSYHTYQRLNPDPDFESLISALKSLWLDASSTGYPNELVYGISCPVLIVRGDQDLLFSRESAVKLTGDIQGAALLNIPFAGHVAFAEQPEMFRVALSQFLIS